MNVCELPVATIYPRDGLTVSRAINRSAVQKLADSITENGLINPISVRAVRRVISGLDADAWEIVSGHHRYEAFLLLQRETIPAQIVDKDDLHAELAMIDENIARTDLSPAEEAAHVARRKEIYEMLHPETVHGAIGNGREKSGQVGHSTFTGGADRFTKNAADATGKSERDIRRAARRGKELGADTLKKVSGTSLDKGKQLDALIDLTEDERDELITRAASGERVTAHKKQQREAVKKENKEIDSDIVDQHSYEFASFLFEHHGQELPMLVTWLEGCKPAQVIDWLHRISRGEAA
jgi:ParB family transcriptional regulator, chromosome partitioning protein